MTPSMLIAELRRIEKLSGVLLVGLNKATVNINGYQVPLNTCRIIEEAVNRLPVLLDIAEAAIADMDVCYECRMEKIDKLFSEPCSRHQRSKIAIHKLTETAK